jgi:primosomal protein N'
MKQSEIYEFEMHDRTECHLCGGQIGMDDICMSCGARMGA